MSSFQVVESTNISVGIAGQMMEDPLTALLTNPPICFCVLKYITNLSDLKAVRLVSRCWRDVSLRHWRATAAVIRLMPTKGKLYASEPDKFDKLMGSIVDFDEFLEAANEDHYNINEYPFRHYEVWIYDFSRINVGHQFWDRWGKFTKYLRLCHFSTNTEHTAQSINYILSKCTNMEEISIVNADKHLDWELQSQAEMLSTVTFADVKPVERLVGVHVANLEPYASAESLTEESAKILARLFSNIQRLTLDSVKSGFVEILKYTQQMEQPIKLRWLRVEDERSDPDCGCETIPDYLESVMPPLEHLEWSGYHFGETVFYILQICRSTLTNVTIDICSDSYPCSFPEMKSSAEDRIYDDFPRLTHLSVSGPLEISLRNLEQMPNLKVFEMTPAEGTTELEVGCRSLYGVLEHLEHLRMEHYVKPRFARDRHGNLNIYDYVPKFTPNLKKLTIDVHHNDDIPALVKALQENGGKLQWQQLEELVVMRHAGGKVNSTIVRLKNN